MTFYYPAFLDLRGRRCVVVGGGVIATRKVQTLLDAEAEVVLVAPDVTTALAQLARSGRIEHRSRTYQPGDLDGAVLVIAATDDTSANAAVARDARARRVLVNAVDDAPNCDFIAPSIVRRGDLAVAISTGGKSPAFARLLREDLETSLSDDYLALFDLLAEVREELRSRGVIRSGEVWHEAIGDGVRQLLASGDRVAARQRLLERLAAAAPGPAH